MSGTSLETRMRAGEYFSAAALPPGMWSVVRVDGRGFSRVTRDVGTAKPFDEPFAQHMLDAAAAVRTALGGSYAYTQSDEISVLLLPDLAPFGGRIEKLTSVAASAAAGTLSVALGRACTFDARVWIGASPQAAAEYFRWRMQDAERNALSGAAYWALRASGLDGRAATARTEGLGRAELNELLFSLGINFNDLPAWQRRGAAIYRRAETRSGVDPMSGPVTVTRRTLRPDTELPYGEAHGTLITTILADELAARERP